MAAVLVVRAYVPHPVCGPGTACAPVPTTTSVIYNSARRVAVANLRHRLSRQVGGGVRAVRDGGRRLPLHDDAEPVGRAVGAVLGAADFGSSSPAAVPAAGQGGAPQQGRAG